MNTNLVAKHNSSFQDYTSQLQGNGDLAILNFILVRHTSILNIVELGTFAGVTSLHLGVSMGLRERGRLYTFDVVDNRHPNVKKMFRKLIGQHLISNCRFRRFAAEACNRQSVHCRFSSD